MSRLTIAIPTYNRSTTLDLLLQSIHNQDCPDIEVIVMDNASTDDTKLVVSNYIHKLFNIKYICHEFNLGSDRNFVECFTQSTSDYLWIVGDDELLFEGCIQNVLMITNEYDFGCLYLSSRAVTLENLPAQISKSCRQRVKPIIFDSWNFARFINYRMTFLSGVIVNKAALHSTCHNIYDIIKKFTDSNLVHLSWVCSAILTKGQSLYVSSPLFASTIANSGGYNPVNVFIKNLGDIYDYFFSKINPNPRQTVNLLTLLGWFPKVSYDLRFTNKYRSGPQFTLVDFPSYLRCGIKWALLCCVCTAPKPIAFLSVFFMKIAYVLFLRYILLTKAIKDAD